MLRKINLIEYFESGIKSDTKLKIGTEHEKFILNKRDAVAPLLKDFETPFIFGENS